MDYDKINNIKHDIVKIRQSLHSYYVLLENPQFNISHKKLREILHNIDTRCNQLTDLIFNGVNAKEE